MAQRVEILGFIYRAKERKEQENVKLSVPELTDSGREENIFFYLASLEQDRRCREL